MSIPLSKSQINKVRQTVASLNVLVVGDCMLDHYIWGDVHRISPEAPVPVVNIDKDTYRLGGACNVALNLSHMGCKVSLMGLVGNDADGEIVRRLLREAHINFLEGDGKDTIDTIVKTRVVIRNQQLCRLDREHFFTEKQTEHINALVENVIGGFDAVIVSDYNKGTVSQVLLDRLVALKKSHKFFLAIDPKPDHCLNYSGADLLKPNRVEALQLSGLSVLPHQDFPLQAIVNRILQKHQVQYLAITLGASGLALFDSKGNGNVFAAHDREVFDVSGAGDTALVALVLGFCSGFTTEEIASFANIASGIVVGKVGTATVNIQELLDHVQ